MKLIQKNDVNQTKIQERRTKYTKWNRQKVEENGTQVWKTIQMRDYFFKGNLFWHSIFWWSYSKVCLLVFKIHMTQTLKDKY